MKVIHVDMDQFFAAVEGQTLWCAFCPIYSGSQTSVSTTDDRGASLSAIQGSVGTVA